MVRTLSPLARWFFRPTIWEEEEGWPELTMTEGLDMYEEDDKVVVKAPVPGIPADKVEVTFEDGVLRIRAKVEQKEEEKKRKKIVYRKDRVVSFDYTATIPRPINQDSIEANVEEGVITVTAKIAEEARPKKIPVKTVKKK